MQTTKSTDEQTLDEGVEEFRKAAHQAVDWVADYLRSVDSLPVLSRDEPGDVRARFDAHPHAEGRELTELLREFETKVMPGITHWNHPAFFAYFSITGSQAGILGELLSAALNANGMLWKTSPALTELETLVLDWLREALGLPEGLFGIINDTASINSFLALAAAREATGLSIRTEGMTGRAMPQLRVYCSDQAHSSIEKGALALGFGTRGVKKIESDENFRMSVPALEKAIQEDREEGAIPCAISTTAGTTSTGSVDPIEEIGRIAARENVWLHVDAAYGGSAAINPEFRFIWDGIRFADSIVINPHKWLFTPVDCSVLYTRRPEVLKETFSLVPEYLKTTESSPVINYMDYGVQLGRRFRALKLWMVLEHYGTRRLGEMIGQHAGYARRLAEIIRSKPDYELVAPQMFSVVVFRKTVRRADGSIDEVASEQASADLLERMNASGDLFVSHTKLHGRYGIRVAIGNGATQWKHIERIVAHL